MCPESKALKRGGFYRVCIKGISKIFFDLLDKACKMFKSKSTPRPLEVVSCFSILGKLIDLNSPGVVPY